MTGPVINLVPAIMTASMIMNGPADNFSLGIIIGLAAIFCPSIMTDPKNNLSPQSLWFRYHLNPAVIMVPAIVFVPR